MIFLPGDSEDKAAIEADFPEDEQVKQAVARRSLAEPTEHGVFSFFSDFLFAPLVIKEPGVIRVRALLGGDLLRLGTLKVEKYAPKPDPNPEAFSATR